MNRKSPPVSIFWILKFSNDFSCLPPCLGRPLKKTGSANVLVINSRLSPSSKTDLVWPPRLLTRRWKNSPLFHSLSLCFKTELKNFTTAAHSIGNFLTAVRLMKNDATIFGDSKCHLSYWELRLTTLPQCQNDRNGMNFLNDFAFMYVCITKRNTQKCKNS